MEAQNRIAQTIREAAGAFNQAVHEGYKIGVVTDFRVIPAGSGPLLTVDRTSVNVPNRHA